MFSPEEQAKLEALERRVEGLERRRGQRRYLIAALGLAILVGAPFAVGATGDPIKEGVRNPPGAGTGASAETAIIGKHGGFVTRQSNINQGDGGSAIYGCRSTPSNEPCINAVNLLAGRSFLFETAGSEGGRIEADGPDAKPFTTNAREVATGLNADEVDGADVCRTDGVLTMNASFDPADRKSVCTQGSLELKAECFLSNSGAVRGRLILFSSASDTFVASPQDDSTSFTGSKDLLILTVFPGTQVANGDTGFYAGFPGGSQLSGRLGIRATALPGTKTCDFVVGALG
jgi:hypothetical protein